jgi:Ca2+:H+ antiporter
MIAQTMSSFLLIVISVLILPTAVNIGLPHSSNMELEVLALSRGTAIILLIIYVLFLVYQLKTHAYVFDMENLCDEGGEAGAMVAPWACASMLFIATVAVSICSDSLVDSIDEVVKSFGISKTFIGLIIVPFVGNIGISMASYR